MNIIEIRYGVFFDSIEEQLKEQGLKFKNADEGEWCEHLRDNITQLMFSEILTESETNRAFNRLTKRISKEVRPIDAPDDEDNENDE